MDLMKSDTLWSLALVLLSLAMVIPLLYLTQLNSAHFIVSNKEKGG